MKKFLMILLISLSGLVASAQTDPFLQVGVSAGVDRAVNQYVEFGITSNKNRVSALLQSYDSSAITREYLVGAKYARVFKLLPDFDGIVSLAGKVHTEDAARFTVEPGLGIEAHLGRKVSFITGVTSPITQNAFGSRKFSFAGNVGLKFTF